MGEHRKAGRAGVMQPMGASGSVGLIIANATVFISSFCIMVIELVAGRLIAKYLGSSLHTWTSIIGVVLAGIAIGNAIGGRLADKFAHDVFHEHCWRWVVVEVGVLGFVDCTRCFRFDLDGVLTGNQRPSSKFALDVGFARSLHLVGSPLYGVDLRQIQPQSIQWLSRRIHNATAD